jgi:hypothetical protein
MRNASNQGLLNALGCMVGGIALLGAVGCQAMLDDGAFDDGDFDSTQSAMHGIDSDVVLDWNRITAEAITAHNGYFDPFTASRTLAMVHIAIHDAINSVQPSYETYHRDLPRDRKADRIAAAAASAHGVLLAEFPDQAVTLDAHLANSLAQVKGNDARQRGVALGEAVASIVVADRTGDGSEIFGSYTSGGQPGDYEPTAPFFIAFRPAWGEVKPFALASGDQFRVSPPPALGSAQYAIEYDEVKSKGRIDSTTRTADETEYAAFWYELADVGWNRVARTVTVSQGLRLAPAARLFALVNMAMADAYIAGVESKYHYAFWRPITAIPAGDTDGNLLTAPDAGWEPFLPTPPVPDHPSTHSAVGDAGARVLAHLLGDATSFTMTSTSAIVEGSTRSFSSFSQAANENADSRVMAGLHFRSACDDGQALGREIGDFTVANYLRRY